MLCLLSEPQFPSFRWGLACLGLEIVNTGTQQSVCPGLGLSVGPRWFRKETDEVSYLGDSSVGGLCSTITQNTNCLPFLLLTEGVGVWPLCRAGVVGHLLGTLMVGCHLFQGPQLGPGVVKKAKSELRQGPGCHCGGLLNQGLPCSVLCARAPGSVPTWSLAASLSLSFLICQQEWQGSLAPGAVGG